jgi:hypothetical protein
VFYFYAPTEWKNMEKVNAIDSCQIISFTFGLTFIVRIKFSGCALLYVSKVIKLERLTN